MESVDIIVKNPFTNEDISVSCNVMISCNINGDSKSLMVSANGIVTLDEDNNVKADTIFTNSDEIV